MSIHRKQIQAILKQLDTSRADLNEQETDRHAAKGSEVPQGSPQQGRE
jgi:hypothetical protein